MIKAYRLQNFDWWPLIKRVLEGETQTAVAKSSRVPQQTLNRHYHKYLHGVNTNQPELVAEALGRADGRRRSYRILSDAAEQKLVDEYNSTTAARQSFVERDFVAAAQRVYLDDHDHLTRSKTPHDFVASKRFINRFKRQHHISSGRVSKRHKPNTHPTPEQQREQTTEYHERVNVALIKLPPDLIINADETSAVVVTPPLTSWRDIGSGAPNVDHTANSKLNVTMVAAVACNGKKLPVALIAAGKTQLSLRKFGLAGSTVGMLSPKGWMDGKRMIEWINRVLLPYTRGRECALVVDSVKSHHTAEVRRYLEANDIDLIVVPGWSTPHLQPLDVGVFGPLKSMMRKGWRLGMQRRDPKTDTLAGLVKRFNAGFKRISRRTIVNSFADAGFDVARISKPSH